mgnify:CR=1 FL=1
MEEVYVFAAFLFISCLVIAKAEQNSDERTDKHLKGLKLGSKVLIINGYFTGDTGEIIEYVPYKKLAPHTYQEEGFQVKLDKQVSFFRPYDLILKQEKK